MPISARKPTPCSDSRAEPAQVETDAEAAAARVPGEQHEREQRRREAVQEVGEIVEQVEAGVGASACR